MYRLWVIAIALAAPAAHAAEAATPATPQATDAKARVPQHTYHSAFGGYQPFREQKLAPWRELNDEVHKAGGHIGIVGGATGKPAAHPPGHKK
jgi:hypothetical protein